MASPELAQKTYRLTNLPGGCDLEAVRQLFPVSTREQIERASLVDAHMSIGGSASSKIATITFASEPPQLKSLNFQTGGLLGKFFDAVDEEFASVYIDSNFYGWTPLSVDKNVEGSKIVDIVAVTGLAGKAFASWQGDDGSMWLRDHLPSDVRGIRTSVFGYKSELSPSNSRAVLADFTEEFLGCLIGRTRDNPYERQIPLILIGHSLGGLIIKQAWSKCAKNKRLDFLHRAIYGLVFFGTPHDGMLTGPWLNAIMDEPPENLVRDLTPDSSTMMALKEDFAQASKDIKIITCYERRETPTSVKQANGTLKRCGPPAMMVREGSACLGWGNEKIIPINENHSMIAKLTRRDGSAYHRVKDAIADMVEEAKVIVPKLFLRSKIRDQLRNIASSSTIVHRMIQSATGSESAVRRSIEQGLVRMFGLCDTLLQDPFGEFFLGAQASSKYIDLIAEVIEELDHIIRTHFNFGSLNSEAQPLDIAIQFGHKIFRLTETLQQTMSSRMLQVPHVGTLSGASFGESGLAHIARQQQLFRSAWEMQPASPLPGALHLFPKPPDRPFSEDLALGGYTPNSEEGFQSQTVIVEHRRFYPPKHAHELSRDEEEYAEKVRLQTKKLAALLSRLDGSSDTIDSLHTLHCLGFIDNGRLDGLSFLYEIPPACRLPDGSISPHFTTLARAIPKLSKSPLEVRFSLAYRVCAGILNIHSAGWVHENICSANILCAAAKDREETLRTAHWNLYIKGFEASREVTATSNREGQWDEYTLYRHPDRQEAPVEKFIKEYDIYSLGLVLLEIGTGELIERVFANVKDHLRPGEELTPFGWRSVLLKWARKKLPSAMGTGYATAVVRCIEGDFQVSCDDDQQTELGLVFQRTVLQPIAAGVTF